MQGTGGGYNLDSAYSAIYSQPGVQGSQTGMYGFGQVFYIHGSSVSVRSATSMTAFRSTVRSTTTTRNSLSNLGLARDRSVHRAARPASGSSATLGGYVNQVIKTGTFPGYAQANLGIGTPGFYRKAGVEAGGATPDRLFSWYVGIQGNNQTYNTIDNNNGAGIPTDGSGPDGIFSSDFNPIAGVFTDYGNGPYRRVRPTGRLRAHR